jgi:hypothetical protein
LLVENDKTSMLKHLHRKKVMTISQVSNALGCAVITARRRMKDWHAFRSCNQNGKFYTLPEIPSFDDHGLWRYEGVLFSKHGNLMKTLIHLIKEAEAGMSGPDVTRLMGLSSNSSIVYQLRDAGLLRIERVMGRVALFDGDVTHYQRQRAAREIQQSAQLPKCEVALLILVELIKDPGIEMHQIVRALRTNGRTVSEGSIHRLLEHYGLLKKTPDMTI